MSERTGSTGSDDLDDDERPARGKVEFSDEQNREIARIVRREVEKAKRVAATAAEGEVTERVSREVDEMRAALTKYETENRQLRARSEVVALAARYRASNPDAVFRLVKDDITFDESGKPVEVESQIKALKADMPQLFSPSASGADGGAGGEEAAGDDMNSIIRDAIRRKVVG